MQIDLKLIFRFYPFIIVFTILIFTLEDSIVRRRAGHLRYQGRKSAIISNQELEVWGGVFEVS